MPLRAHSFYTLSLTTLFRSRPIRALYPVRSCHALRSFAQRPPQRTRRHAACLHTARFLSTLGRTRRIGVPPAAHLSAARSEEHTSELQSRQYLVCRLLLEKK